MVETFNTPRDENLIFDVGMHDGRDTDYYLKKGFRVVAFDANHDLVMSAKVKFSTAISSGQLTIVEGAIVDSEFIRQGNDAVTFYINEDDSSWGTSSPGHVKRNKQYGTRMREVSVNAVDMVEIMKTQGVPYYMKVDIEGSDRLCLEALKHFKNRPAYVSYESSKTSFDEIRYETDILSSLGYDAFIAVEQSRTMYQNEPSPAQEGKFLGFEFEFGMSGLFGRDLGGEWLSQRVLLNHYKWIALGYRLLGDYGILNVLSFPGSRYIRGSVRRILQFITKAPVPGWYDTHARHSSWTAGRANV